MLDGLVDVEVDLYLDDHPRIIPLFNIFIVEAVHPYMSRKDTVAEETLQDPDPKSMDELRHSREALECKLAMSQ